LGWTIEYDPEAIKDLNKLNRSIRLEIFRYMQERIAQADTPRNFGKPLRCDKFGLWRYRVRDFRIICELQEARQVVLVVGVGHRKSVYE
jgi:mRNA interferase RelE/StbE